MNECACQITNETSNSNGMPSFDVNPVHGCISKNNDSKVNHSAYHSLTQKGKKNAEPQKKTIGVVCVANHNSDSRSLSQIRKNVRRAFRLFFDVFRCVPYIYCRITLY